MSEGIRCMWMRGGTSKGAYFLSEDLPSCPEERNSLLLRIMGSPDPRQIDGMGGADPLTSKVAVVSDSDREGIDIDYLFLQVHVDEPHVSDLQNCGNILAGVGPFAVERQLVTPNADETTVVINMENSGQTALCRIQTPTGRVSYSGTARIDGVPGTSAPVAVEFLNTAGSSCGKMLPSGSALDQIDGVPVTLIDNGMPCVVLRASDLLVDGYLSPMELESNSDLRTRLESLRLRAGLMMNLGDVKNQSVPKMTIVSPPRFGGVISTRTFIPHRCHKSIGVLGAVSVATACALPDSVACNIARIPSGRIKPLSIEHPTGQLTVLAHFDRNGKVIRAEILRTARKLFDGSIFPVDA